MKKCSLCNNYGRIALAEQVCQKCYDKLKLRKVYMECECGRKVRGLKDGKVICGKCNKKNKKPPKCECVKCGRISHSGHRENGQPICHKCYLKTYKTPLVKCSKCGLIKNIFTRNPDILCHDCYMKEYDAPKHKCLHCGEISVAHKKVKGGYICKKCYRQNYRPPKKKCAECGKYKEGCNSKSKKCPSCHNKERLKNDEQYLIRTRVRKRISKVFKKCGVSKKYPINYDKIADFLGPCPGKREEFHIDHIFPLVAFDLTNENQLKAALAPQNHQWLKVNDNCSKKSSYDVIEFRKYLEEFVDS